VPLVASESSYHLSEVCHHLRDRWVALKRDTHALLRGRCLFPRRLSKEERMEATLPQAFVEAAFTDWAAKWRNKKGPATVRQRSPEGRYCLKLWQKDVEIRVVPMPKSFVITLVRDHKFMTHRLVYSRAPKNLSSEASRIYILDKIRNQIRSLYKRAQQRWAQEEA
jgi:hypothetical protein